jgi:outer membrane protein assembly factor BamD
VQSYQALGMNDLSSDAMRVFKLNFPDSQIFKTGVRVQKERRWWQFWVTK